MSVIAYYSGSFAKVDSLEADKLTHIIHSFSFLKSNRLHIATSEDSLTIKKMVLMKKRNRKLKVLLSLGGWGGCQTCSDVFSNSVGRKEFARSVRELNDYFGTDGIDLDWEFPALPSLPGHGYQPEDKQNFTLLLNELRNELGSKMEISFAAGGFKWTLNKSIEWGSVMKLADRVHLMSYDFVNGKNTGHNAALFSSAEQQSSADYFIKYLLQLGVPKEKIVIGAAFYARRWDSVPLVNKGLYQPGKASGAVPFRDIDTKFPVSMGYVRLWDSISHSSYLYNNNLGHFVSYESEKSVKEKVQYAQQQQLNGIMFWQLNQDRISGGLLNAIYEEKKKVKGR